MSNDEINQLILLAGEAEQQPPLPPGGIPEQKVPGWVRWSLRVLLLPFVLFDLWMQNIAKMIIRPPFRQTGRCHRRGNCCYYILLPKTKGWLGKLHLFWSTEIHGFYFRTKETIESDGKPVYVMGCRYLQKNGSCGCYFLRPMVCRKWPVIEYFGYPRLLKGCGFKAELRSKKYAKFFQVKED